MEREVAVEAEESFQAYVRARAAALSRIAYLLTGDVHEAEDVVQETLLRVVGRWRRVVAQGDPDAYVRRALYHQHISLWRRRRHRPVPHPFPPDRPVADPAAAVTGGVALRAALARLAPRQRAVLVLRYFEDLTEVQTADVLGCSVGTVKSQTRDALARLRAIAPELAEPLPAVTEVSR
ncbi:MAG TPA: SigE family RNA polymerase sigma factor [Micromonospora sp.]